MSFVGRVAAAAVAVAALGWLGLELAARMDGPWGMLPGGAFRGAETDCPVDWSDQADAVELEIEVRPDAPRSMTIWSAVDQGELFLAADFLTPFKFWPHQLLADGRVRIRTGEGMFACRATRDTDPVRIERVRATIAEKYGIAPDGWVAGAEVWWFRVAPSAPRTPSIVILSLDTLRADHLSAYGYSRPTSPVLDAFASEAVRFDEAIAQASGTLPSHLSLLTSLNPPQFQITRPDGRNDIQGTTTLRIPDAVATLAEVLRDAGYETAAFTDGGPLHPRYGFAQGFDVFRVNATRGLRRTLAELDGFAFERALRPEADRQAPVFLFLHTFDIHAPYDAPAPFATRFSAGTFARLRASSGEGRLLESLAAQPRPDDATLGEVQALYDNGIAWTDAGVGMLFEWLRAQRWYEDSIVVVLSDHGEEFYEHGGFNHGVTLYREQVRVPLLMRLPGGRRGGQVIEVPIGLVDLAPTLLELIGLEPAPSFAGRSVASWIEAGPPSSDPTVPIYFETPDRRTGLRGLQLGSWKLIRRDGSGEVELYDLKNDPGERQDIAAQQAARAKAMADQLTRWVARMGSRARESGWLAVHNAAAPELSSSQREALEALGYLDGSRD